MKEPSPRSGEGRVNERTLSTQWGGQGGDKQLPSHPDLGFRPPPAAARLLSSTAAVFAL
jgi:hypothetical protein